MEPATGRSCLLTETVSSILAAYRDGISRPEDIVARSYARIRAHADPAVFITLRDEHDALAEARGLAAEGPCGRPLFGIPIAIKDNIDVAGMPTTAACPDFAYKAHADAACVARLKAAGAIIIGKTNLDQFATGLNGTRSPYGVPRNPLKPGLIPGGSSSGSAVAVAAGLVPLALGTDTAGSGRVPAMYNNIVGVKPSVGLVSTHGVVPACRTLDCVSVFALTVDDGFEALKAIAGLDRKDPYSRAIPLADIAPPAPGLTVGVPATAARVFFGDAVAAASYQAALDRLAVLGIAVREIDIEPFYETARLLYEGPWVAERFLVVRKLLASSPGSLHPVTREVVMTGAGGSAADVFANFYELEELRRIADVTFRDVDALALPTAPTLYTIDELLADPIQLNSRLGIYTNFTNLLNLCALALPSALTADRKPYGVTLLAPSGCDAMLAGIGREFHAHSKLPLGALDMPQPPLVPLAKHGNPGDVTVAVVGAHLSGMPLNDELCRLNAKLLAITTTSADYRLFELSGTRPPKPGLLRVAPGSGKAIEVELWALSIEAFGRFVADVPPPLSIGTVALAGGGSAKGFLVEANAVSGARDISSFGGWRRFMASVQAAK